LPLYSFVFLFLPAAFSLATLFACRFSFASRLFACRLKLFAAAIFFVPSLSADAIFINKRYTKQKI